MRLRRLIHLCLGDRSGEVGNAIMRLHLSMIVDPLFNKSAQNSENTQKSHFGFGLEGSMPRVLEAQMRIVE